MSDTSNRRRGRIIAAVAGLGMVAGILPAVTASATPVSPDGETDKVSSQVRAEIAENGETDVWVRFSARADLNQFHGLSWEDRGQGVYDALRATADDSQGDLRAELDEAGVDYSSYFIANAIKVDSADLQLVQSMAANSAVASVIPEFEVEQVEPVLVQPADQAPNAVEWGVDNINAPAVWGMGFLGEGITVATIDTGVQGDHPALVNSYRGTDTGSDDYNWFDPQGGASSPTDYNGHGTHVTGTMVGDDGAGNQIGVAPGAQWIAAAGCCPSDEALLSSMQWMLAPTPVGSDAGDPAMRPHVVNNSWGSEDPSNDPFGEEISQAWVSSGIFGVWANGNSGPECSTSGSPGSRTINYSVGAYDVNNAISDFSGRGPGQDGQIKPNISAPGEDIVSAYPGDAYAIASGTSMAAPHTAGAIALLLSSNPDLVGDTEAIAELLNTTAIDTEDLQCGGTAENNPVFGEGRLDALALVEAGGSEPEPDPEVERVWGENRYGTAQELSDYFPDGSETVYIASGQGFPDAMSGSPAAARGLTPGVMETPEGDAAPVLLTRQGSLASETVTALDDLAPAKIVVLGGTTTISQSVEDELNDGWDAEVTRVAGEDRYETAANLAAMFPSDLPVVYVASGENPAYPDALTGAALAGANDAPVLLTRKGTVPAATAAALVELNPQSVVVLGGPASVSDAVYTALGASDRLFGDDRYATAVDVSSNYETDVPVVYIANGRDYPDALASSALAGSEDVPVLITRPDMLPGVIEAELNRLSPERVVIVGGTNSVSQSVEDRLNELYPGWIG